MAIEEALARGAQIVVALIGAYLAVLYFVSIVWAYRDIETRSRSVVTQIFSTLLVVLFPFLGIPLYLVLRPKDTLDSSFQKSLEEEYLLQDLEELPLCPSCQHYVSEDFVLCPHCHTQLRDNCASCDRLVDLRWTLCPYCAAPQSGHNADEQVEAPAARWSRPSVATPVAVPERVAPAEPQVAAAATVGQLVSQRGPGRTEVGKLTVVGGRAYRSSDRADIDDQPRRGRFLRPATASESASAPGSDTRTEREQVPMRADGD
jgi:RNA polymerase subunit RPABC4/transcription elongation factor Spt4